MTDVTTFRFFRCLDCGFSGSITMEEIAKHRAACSRGTTEGIAEPAAGTEGEMFPKSKKLIADFLDEVIDDVLSQPERPEPTGLPEKPELFTMFDPDLDDTFEGYWREDYERLEAAYESLKQSHAALVEALIAAQEELRLIRMKDSNAVYDVLLRSVTIPIALETARKVSA